MEMEKMLASADKEVLVEMVKLSQKRGMSGSEGHWKKFLASHDKKFGTSLSDPSRRSLESLLAFLKTFTEEEHLNFFKKILECHSNRAEVEELKNASPESETAEQMLVRLTLEHPLYAMDYSFPSHEEDWMVIRSSEKYKAVNSNEIIAIDCEMVLCEDGTEALVKVCTVDRDLKVKLLKIVNPNKAIADYRTPITGISAKDLDGVTRSLKDVQKSMKKLLKKGAILVGHSLNNDLQALKIDHTRVIDTSYLFKYSNGPVTKRPSLSFLCQAMLGYELREDGKPHNCMDDACAAMKLVLARLGGKISDVISDEVKAVDIAKLLVHRIPVNILCENLQSVIPGDYTIEAKLKKKHSPTYSAFAIFKSQQEADEAFDNLKGDVIKDTLGRPQKLVKFELDSGKAGTICVCKTILDGNATQLPSNKRLAEDEYNSASSKKCKTNQIGEQLGDSNRSLSECEMHMKEIERLKQELSHRDKEISSLNKLIVALARKQGL